MSPLGKKLVKSVSIYRYKRINKKLIMKSTLTIPTLNIGSPAGEDTVLDIDEISLVQQTSDTSTTIYTQKASIGDVTLTHSTASAGSLGNAINELLLKSAGGSAILPLPSGVEITSITFS
jgi:hypothetical protein